MFSKDERNRFCSSVMVGVVGRLISSTIADAGVIVANELDGQT